MSTINFVTMSVYASKDQEMKADGRHRRSSYNLLYQQVDERRKEKGPQGTKKMTGPQNPWIGDDSVFRTLDLTQEWDSSFRFRLALWSTDENINEGESWARCTFRPAHQAGAVDLNHAYPMSRGDFEEYLQGAYLNDTEKWQDLSEMNPTYFGMKVPGQRSYAPWQRNSGQPYTFSKCWQRWGHSKVLSWGGKYEIGVQVGLCYTDGTEKVFCEVDPEMDLGGG